MKIGIDFDRTLFDTDKFKQHLEDKFPRFSDTYKDAFENGIYRPSKHADLMGIDLKELYGEMQQCSEFLYGDVEKLQKLRDHGHVLFLVTRGDREFQRLKIRGSGISEYFDQVKIVSKPINKMSKDDVVQLDLLIDDRQDELDSAEIRTIKSRPDNKNVSDLVDRIIELEK